MADNEEPERKNSKRRSVFDPLGRIMDTVVPSVTDAVDVDDIVRRIDVDELLSRVDVDELMQRIDVDALMARVDVEALLGRVDVNALVHRVDPNALLARIDVDALMARIDVDELVARVDVDAIVDRVDVDKVMQRADIAGVVAQSTRGMTARTLDLARRQVAGVDEIITRLAARVLRRDPALELEGPPQLEAEIELADQTPTITGHYAGPVARALALTLDWVTMVFLFGVGTAIASWTIDLLVGDTARTWGLSTGWSGALLVGWAFVYFAVPTALTGRTFGKAVIGLRVVTSDGAPLPAFRVALRVVTLPLSFALFGLGLVGAVIGRRRRTLHDVTATSAVIIDWGDRPASIPNPLNNWLVERAASRR
ncbi:MAG: RDD family protein [Ilumatobacteraceae bacterium]